MAKTNPFTFIQQVREEAAKISWPSRKETMISTVMVMVMVTFASIFFLIVDFLLKTGIDKILFRL